jgi:methionyl-tRNA formyltransferase
MKILLLAGNTLRSNAYAQYLAYNSFDIFGLFYGFNKKEYSAPKLNLESKQFFKSQNLMIPEFEKGILEVFKGNNFDFTQVEDFDVNSETILNQIKAISPDLVIFSGYGGQILKKEHFELGIPYIHMHPGDIPKERGSTTIYYSILNRKACTVTAFLMNEKIDAGNIIVKSHFQAPLKNVDIDQYYDHIIRASCLIDALEALFDKKEITPFPRYDDSLEYYVIHPLLKNISILSLNK